MSLLPASSACTHKGPQEGSAGMKDEGKRMTENEWSADGRRAGKGSYRMQARGRVPGLEASSQSPAQQAGAGNRRREP